MRSLRSGGLLGAGEGLESGWARARWRGSGRAQEGLRRHSTSPAVEFAEPLGARGPGQRPVCPPDAAQHQPQHPNANHACALRLKAAGRPLGEGAAGAWVGVRFGGVFALELFAGPSPNGLARGRRGHKLGWRREWGRVGRHLVGNGVWPGFRQRCREFDRWAARAVAAASCSGAWLDLRCRGVGWVLSACGGFGLRA